MNSYGNTQDLRNLINRPIIEPSMTFEKNVLQPNWNQNLYQARLGDGFGSLGGTEKSLVDLFNDRMN